ncbi:unnamed protein product [Arabidopsis lyrata]|nr:unnamed protein product [Arabidopsis lyrata]
MKKKRQSRTNTGAKADYGRDKAAGEVVITNNKKSNVTKTNSRPE